MDPEAVLLHVEGRYVLPSRLRHQAAVALAANGDFPH